MGRRNIVAILLKFGANIDNRCGMKGNTPLMWAAWRNNLKMVEFLIEMGADITLENKQGQDVMDI